MIDTILVEALDKTSKDQNVAVLLSGGVDSNSLAFAAKRLNKNIKAYTFKLQNTPNYDSDKASEVAKLYNFECEVIEVPTNNLEQDFIKLAKEYNCIKKTHFECTFPFLYVYPKIKEYEIISGIAADGHYGVSKKACIHYKSPKSKFDEFRIKYFSQKNPAGLIQQQLLAKQYGKKFIAPYLESDIINFFRKYDWYELNKPFQKHHVVTAFNEFKNFKFKKHINLQLGSGINHLFETLIQNKNINLKNRKRVMDICKDWSSNQGLLTI